jgi:arsenate reductase
MDIIIHHFPECGTSTHALKIIRDAGYDPVVNEYMKTGWTKPQLIGLFEAAGMTARRALRIHKTNAKELGLTAEGVSEDEILDAMVVFPKLVNRPIVVTDDGVALCRPSEAVLDLLPNWPAGPYPAKDGSPLIDADGNRVD